jgi:hypothetical protein
VCADDVAVLVVAAAACAVGVMQHLKGLDWRLCSNNTTMGVDSRKSRLCSSTTSAKYAVACCLVYLLLDQARTAFI